MSVANFMASRRFPNTVNDIDLAAVGRNLGEAESVHPEGEFVLVRHGTLPLGVQVVRNADDRAEAIARFTPPDGQAIPATPDTTDVAVIVCTKNRPALLDTCLSSIAALAPQPREVLVVDNGSSDDSTSHVAASHGIRVVSEPQAGLDRARNRGIAETTAPIVAFLDDDTRPAPWWAGAVHNGFANGAVGAVSGLVLAAELHTWPQRAFERNGGMSKGFDVCEYGRDTQSFGYRPFLAGVGGNVAFRRTVLDADGGFDPALDVGTTTGGGGDLDMLFRVHEAGSVIRYDPSMFVRHVHRSEFSGLVRQLIGYGSGYTAFLEKQAQRTARDRIEVGRVLRRWHVRRHVLGLGRAAAHLDGFNLLTAIAEAWGSLSGARAYRSERRELGGSA